MLGSVEVVAATCALQKYTNALQSEDKRVRKKALLDLQDFLYSNKENAPPHDFCSWFELVQKPVLRCFSDQAEACRELSVTLMRDILEFVPTDEQHLSNLVPVLTQRLGSIELVEPSEEVRFILVELLKVIVQKYTIFLPTYLNELVIILSRTIIDPYPKIKKESCDCAASLAASIPQHFHLQSETLVKPIIQNLTHQQYRVRVSAVMALGAVIRYGNNKSVSDVTGPLAERLFDQTQQVREAVTRVVGEWMVSLPDRYSFFSKLIPLMLTCLNDVSPSLQEETWHLWEKAGQQWLEENENDLKDKIDFLTAHPEHYPSHMKRPNLGCRMLVKRNIYKIVPPLVRELEDWLADVRIKASQLLCVLIINAETDIAQYVEQLLLGMYRACNDEDLRVVGNIERAAELMGHFVPVSNYWSLMKPVMEDCCHQGHLRVLASLIHGTPKTDLQSQLIDITELLGKHNICRSRESVYQSQLVQSCVSIMIVCGEDSLAASQQIFNILVTALSLTNSDAVIQGAQGALKDLCKMEKFNSTEDLYHKYMRKLLEDVCTTPELWTLHSSERYVFQTLLQHSGSALGSCLDIVVPALSIALKPDNPDAEMKLKLMTSLALLLVDGDQAQRIPSELMDPFIISLVESVIAPNLVWRAGRTAEALRTITVSCLLAMLQGHSINEQSAINSFLDHLTPILLTLIEDSAKRTRLYTCRVLGRLIRLAQDAKCLKSEHINRIYFVVLKRLDDVNNEVRQSSVEVLRCLFSHLPPDYSVECASAHVEALYATLLIHLDDPDLQFRTLILGALKDLSYLNPTFIFNRLTTTESNYRNPDACKELIAHVSTLVDGL